MDLRTQTRRSQDADRFEAVRESLAGRVARWTAGIEQFATAIPSLTLYRHDGPTEAMNCMIEPAVALTVQGAKRALLGNDVYAYDRHRFLVTSLNLPVVLQVAEASRDTPYLSLVLRLDERAIAELVMECKFQPPSPQPPDRGIALGATTAVLLEAFDRLVGLLDEPAAIPVLAPLIQKEVFYRLLMSEQGFLLWQIASIGSQSHRIAQAIDWLKSNFAQPLHVDELAARVQMSTSRFHHHFRKLTSMSPLQFQKWLRLNQARQLMLTERLDASSAAFQVGYESPSQFSREYSRQFGAPPRRDVGRLLHLHEVGITAPTAHAVADHKLARARSGASNGPSRRER